MSGSLPVAIVGAGAAGLAVSARLAHLGLPHVVLERGRVGWSWSAQRWDSFRLNTPRWANRALGKSLAGERDSFASAGAVLAALEESAKRLPVAEGVEVFSARRIGPRWRLDTTRGSIAADAVVVASGFQNAPRRPRDAGKRVYLATSRVGRLPRRYAGRDAIDWLIESGDMDLAREQADPGAIAGTPPQVSGAGGGRTVSYQSLARRGVTLLGRAAGWKDGRLELAGDLGENVRFADEASSFLRATWEKRARLLARELSDEVDAADEPAPHLYDARGPRSLDVVAEGISTVIWATGFGPSIGWLPGDALDSQHRPQLPGLHVVGAPWLTHRSSANLYGMVSDAHRVVSAFGRTPLRLAA